MIAHNLVFGVWGGEESLMTLTCVGSQASTPEIFKAIKTKAPSPKALNPKLKIVRLCVRRRI